MNRLQLCQMFVALSRIDLPGASLPSTTIGQTGSMYEAVNYVDLAYQDIQNEQNEWLFRIKSGSIALSSGTRQYTISSTVTDYLDMVPSRAHQDCRYITLYLTASGVSAEQRIYYVPWEEWQSGTFDFGTRPEAQPTRWTLMPNGDIAFDPTPDAAYTVPFDYIRTLHAMTTDSHATTGTPIIPSQHHMAIVYKALVLFGQSRNHASLPEWKAELRREMNRLRAKQLPEVRL